MTKKTQIIKLNPIKANAMIATQYNKELQKLVKQMGTELSGKVIELYGIILERSNNSIGLDSPADDISEMLKNFFLVWQHRFESLAEDIATYHVGLISRDTRDKLYRSAKDLITIKPDEHYKDIIRLKSALIKENVQLIVRLPQDMYNRIHIELMKSLQTGNNTKRIYNELLKAGLPPLTYIKDDVETVIKSIKKRAKFIARDQVLKATGLINNQRMIDVGITTAIWRHSHGDKVPRKDHLDADGKEFDTSKGYKFKEGYALPGFLINCTCFAEPVIKI